MKIIFYIHCGFIILLMLSHICNHCFDLLDLNGYRYHCENKHGHRLLQNNINPKLLKKKKGTNRIFSERLRQ